MAKKKHGAIREGSIADEFMKGLSQFMSELSMGDTDPATAKERRQKRRLKNRELYPEEHLAERKRQDEESAPPGQDPDKPKEFEVAGAEKVVQPGEEAKDPGEGAMAAAGRLLNPVAGQKVASGGTHGGTIGDTPAAADSQTVAMQDTIADLQATVARLEQQGVGGGAAAPSPLPGAGGDTPSGLAAAAAKRSFMAQQERNRAGGGPMPAAPTAAETATIGDEFLKQAAPTGAGSPPPLSVQSSALRPGVAWHEGATGTSTAEAIEDGNQQDVANGGGNRGLMAAIGGAFSGAKGAVGGALGGAKDAVGGALSNVAGGPRPPLKAQYKDLSNNELARLERQGIDIYETDPFAQSFGSGR